MTQQQDAIRHTFVVGLRNAHALEEEALSLLDRQIDRLETILDSLGEKPSTFKDATMKLGGNITAMMHALAPDEILKNCFANAAFEAFEVASYKALVVMAEEGGFTQARPLLEETLREEQAMVKFLDETLPLVVQQYLARRGSGETASH